MADIFITDRRSADGRVKADAWIIHGAPDGWLEPGAGKSEWFKDIDIGPEMVVVPAGSFTMGSNDYDSEKPLHRVEIKAPFAVARFAVTFDEWDAAVADGGCNRYRPEEQGWGRGQRPVINVSWEDAKAYAKWLSDRTGKTYRLLSEAEWEDSSVWAGGDASRRVLRGGSGDLAPDFCRSANRIGGRPSYRNWDVGFRLASTLSRRSRQDHGPAGQAQGGAGT